MARRHFAKAILSRTNVPFDDWMENLRNQNEGAVPKDHVNRIAKQVLRKCDPNQYLLSHATIVASVDTFAPKNVKTGRQFNNGVQIDVRWPDFRIKPECFDIINNNNDSWSRSLLLSTYRTFIGSQNYVEHIQLPELSKGFIVDAIARDLDRSVYIDILVATDKKHGKLIQDIVSGDMNSLSMGCFLPGTLVYLGDGTPIEIEKIRPEMEVISQKGNVCRVDNLQIRENRWVIRKIKSVGLTPVEATETHKFYVVPSSSIETSKPTAPGRAQSVVKKDYPFEYLEAGKLKVGDVLATPICQDMVKPDVSLSEARLLGIYAGDGWKWDNKHDSAVGFGICMDDKHQDIIEDVEKIVNQISWASGEMKIVVGGHALKTVSRKSRRNATYILSSCRSARATIDKFIHGRTSLTKSLSQDLMCWPKDHQLAFLGGIIDSDGCVSTNKKGTKQVYISTRNRTLAHQYFQILNRCGIISTISTAKRSGTKMLPNASGTDYQLRLRNDDVQKIPSLKIEKIRESLKSNDVGLNDRWLTNKYLYTRINKIEDMEYEGFVYDLQVDKDHSYIANGVGVSNCISLFTTCTKCGNVAADDASLCPCISYEGKGSRFLDEEGQEQVLAELIGHVSVPNSCQFIEASWVRNPAFRGAVRRNILNPDSTHIASQMTEAQLIHEIRALDPEMQGMKKAASHRNAQDQEEQVSDAPTGSDEPESKPASNDAIDELIKKAQEQLLQVIVDGLGEKLAPKPEDVGSVSMSPPVSFETHNDNLVRSSEEFNRKLTKCFPDQPKLVRWASEAWKTVHEGGFKAIKANRMTSRDLIVLSWIEDRVRGEIYPSHLYKTAMQVGSLKNFPSEVSYLAACKMRLGKSLTQTDTKFLLWKGRVSSIAHR